MSDRTPPVTDPHAAHAHLALTDPAHAELATSEAFALHHADLVGYASRWTGSRDVAEDVVSLVWDGFLRHARRGGFDPDRGCPVCNGRGWLYTRLRWRLKDWGQAEMAERARLARFGAALTTSGGEAFSGSLTAGPDDAYEQWQALDGWQEDWQRVLDGLHGVSRDTLAAVVQAGGEWNGEIVAELLGISGGTANTRLCRLRRRLPALLIANGIIEASSAQ